MAEKYLAPESAQFIGQQGYLRYVDPSTGPDGPNGVTAYWLVPTSGYSSTGQRFPHSVNEDLQNQDYDKAEVEGVEYYLVPENSSNLPGRLAHYAQTTGVAELENPPGGGVNRVRETLAKSAQATVAPDAVEKYVKDNDAFEEARKKESDEDSRTARQVSVSPAREPAEGRLVEGSGEGDQPSEDKPKGKVQEGKKDVPSSKN